jgi:hypothetical protein
VGQQTALAGWSYYLPGLRVGRHAVAPLGMAFGAACSLQQTEFLSPTNGCTAVAHLEPAVNVIGVRAQGVQGHHVDAIKLRLRNSFGNC